ncbi:MAG: hypothetical protein HYS22_05705 [Deltaproteobacteria bacterium]|nr:hypothetical protein [Deltaproteobacteria bacterium]
MPLEPITTRLEKVVELTPTVRTFHLHCPEGKWVSFKGGQFCSIHIPQPGKILRKPYSIASAPYETGTIDLCIKRVEGGAATNWFWSLKKGDKVVITFPYGGFVIKEPVDYNPIFIATGTGLAPLRSMILELFHKKCQREITLIFGVRYENEILYDEEWRKLSAFHKNFCYIPVVSRPQKQGPSGWAGEVGYVQDVLKRRVRPEGKQIYVCGLIPMITAVEKAAAEIGFDKGHVHFEKYV